MGGALLIFSSAPALAGKAEEILSGYHQFAAARNVKAWRIAAPLTTSVGEVVL